MGCSSPQNAGLPNIPAHHLNRLLQVAQINHPLNINKKYEYLARIETSKEVGTGYRKTNAYYALTTKQEMKTKRKQFWETRVNGQPMLWEVIKLAIQTINQREGKALLSQHKLTLLNNSIQMSIDSKGNKYQVPVFCINEPISYSNARIQDKNLDVEYEDKNVEVAIRSAKYPNNDIKFNEQSSCQIEVIKSTIKAMKELNAETKIRLFYNGREMKEDKTLGNYGYQQGTIIQAMIS